LKSRKTLSKITIRSVLPTKTEWRKPYSVVVEDGLAQPLMEEIDENRFST